MGILRGDTIGYVVEQVEQVEQVEPQESNYGQLTAII